MSYTSYPQEAINFASKANGLKERTDDAINGLNEAKGNLSACNNKDLVVTRSIETIENVIKRINKMGNTITSDISTVNTIANELENEARLRALEEQSESEDQVD